MTLEMHFHQQRLTQASITANTIKQNGTDFMSNNQI